MLLAQAASDSWFSMSNWIAAAKEFGLPNVALCATFIFLAAAVVVAARAVWSFSQPYLARIAEGHITMVAAVTESSKTTAESCKVIKETLSEVHPTIKAIGRANGHMAKALEEVPECDERRERVRVHTRNAQDVLREEV